MGVDLVLLVGGVLGVFVALFLGLTAIGVFTNEARGVSKSLTVIEAFSAAPSEMQHELAPPFQERVIAPLLDKSLKLGRKLTASDHGERIRQKLEIAGNPPGWTVDRVTSLKFVGFVVFLAVSLVISLLLGLGLSMTLVVCVGAAVLGYFAPNLYLYQRRLRPDRTTCSAPCRTRWTCSRSPWSRASVSTPPSPRSHGTPKDRWPTSSPASFRRCRSAWVAVRHCGR